jgi:hypothetical protein
MQSKISIENRDESLENRLYLPQDIAQHNEMALSLHSASFLCGQS